MNLVSLSSPKVELQYARELRQTSPHYRRTWRFKFPGPDESNSRRDTHQRKIQCRWDKEMPDFLLHPVQNWISIEFGAASYSCDASVCTRVVLWHPMHKGVDPRLEVNYCMYSVGSHRSQSLSSLVSECRACPRASAASFELKWLLLRFSTQSSIRLLVFQLSTIQTFKSNYKSNFAIRDQTVES